MRAELVRPSAMFPDFAIRPREGPNVPHPYHGRDEVRGEEPGVLVVLLDQGVGGSAVEEDLVGMKETLLVDEVLVVNIVEFVRSRHVERSQVVVPRTDGPRASVLPSLGKGTVYVGLVVNPVPE